MSVRVIKEELDKNALQEYRDGIESTMTEDGKFLLHFILDNFSRRFDIDRAYNSKFINELIHDAILYLVWNKEKYVPEGRELNITEDDRSRVLTWFVGYWIKLKMSYRRDDTFVRSNPHPHEKNVGDCVKRAIVHATGKDYMEVQRELNQIKREIGARGFNSREVWRELVKRYNFQYVKIPAPRRGEPRMNGHKFCIDHPKGTYLLHMAHHLTCCIDGKIYDSWDCRDKAVYQAYLVKGE